MRKLTVLGTAALFAAIGAVGCDRDNSAKTSSSNSPTTDSRPAAHNSDVVTPTNTAANTPGINPGSATDAGPNLGTTASDNPAPSANTAAPGQDISRGSTAVSNSGAPAINDNTGTTLNPHRIEDNAQPAAAQSGMNAQQFVEQAASGGMFEVQSSQLALKKSGNQSVKDFAQQMITDHEKANDQLKTLAQSENVPVPGQLLTKHQQLLDRLNGASADFDKQYSQIQKQAHEETVALFQNASTALSDQKLKDFATQTLPTLQQHLQHTNQLPQ